MFLRKADASELSEYLAVDSCHLGSELVGTAKAVAVWKRLFRSLAFNCAVVEEKSASPGRRILGFGASVFVSSKIVDDELTMPQPGLNARLLQKIDNGDSVALTEQELRAGNSQDGLDLVVLCSCWPRDLRDPEQLSEIQTLLTAGFLRDHAGYRLRRALSEALGEQEIQFAGSSHAWQPIRDFGGSSDQGELHRSLWLITKSNALAVSWSIVGMLFHYREPLLHLRPPDQRLLLAALDGMTDHELSDRLGLQLGTIKKRWISLFDRIADAQPDLLPDVNGEHHDHKRGPQKRHRVLAYVREHPEELRPFGVQPGVRSEGEMEFNCSRHKSA